MSRHRKLLVGLTAALLVLGTGGLAFADKPDPGQRKGPNDNSKAEITVEFSEDCTDFTVDSSKDISFVSRNSNEDFSYAKDEDIDSPTYTYTGDEELKSIVVKSGTTRQVFNCPDGGGEAEPDPDERPECDDGIDNDDDGAVDHPGGMGADGADRDPGCETPDDDDERDPEAEEPEEICDDEVDNDDDDLVDDDDPDCNEGAQDGEFCDDDIDNDGDGLTDEDDPDCNEGAQDGEFCDDDIDNDGDGLTDGDDPDCTEDEEVCDDEVDNDGDGLVDDDDPDCAPAAEVCNDGLDNDGDGLIDGADPDCVVADACTAGAGDPGILTEDTLGQTLWDGADPSPGGLKDVPIPGLFEDPDADGELSGAIYEAGNGQEFEPLTDELACAIDLLIDQNVAPGDL